jgi:hypothetical protein
MKNLSGYLKSNWTRHIKRVGGRRERAREKVREGGSLTNIKMTGKYYEN